jgi:hypothetical protein
MNPRSPCPHWGDAGSFSWDPGLKGSQGAGRVAHPFFTRRVIRPIGTHSATRIEPSASQIASWG